MPPSFGRGLSPPAAGATPGALRAAPRPVPAPAASSGRAGSSPCPRLGRPSWRPLWALPCPGPPLRAAWSWGSSSAPRPEAPPCRALDRWRFLITFPRLCVGALCPPSSVASVVVSAYSSSLRVGSSSWAGCDDIWWWGGGFVSLPLYRWANAIPLAVSNIFMGGMVTCHHPQLPAPLHRACWARSLWGSAPIPRGHKKSRPSAALFYSSLIGMSFSSGA